MIRHKLVYDIETVIHEAKVPIKRKELNRIRHLLDIKDLSIYSDDELKSLGAKRDCGDTSFVVKFDDGSQLIWDLRSGNMNYYDDVVFVYKGREYNLDCSYELDDIEIDMDTDIYIMKLEICK